MAGCRRFCRRSVRSGRGLLCSRLRGRRHVSRDQRGDGASPTGKRLRGRGPANVRSAAARSTTIRESRGPRSISRDATSLPSTRPASTRSSSTPPAVVQCSRTTPTFCPLHCTMKRRDSSVKVKDISEFLVALGPIPPKGSIPRTVDLSRRVPPLPWPADSQSAPGAPFTDSGAGAGPPGRDRDLLRRGRDVQLGSARDVRAARPAQDGPYRSHGCRCGRDRKRGLHSANRPQGQGTWQIDRGRASDRPARPGVPSRV